MNFVNKLGSSAGKMVNSARQTGYEIALKAMFKVDPERIHVMANQLMGTINKVPLAYKALGAALPVKDPILSQEVFGVTFPRPLGLRQVSIRMRRLRTHGLPWASAMQN